MRPRPDRDRLRALAPVAVVAILVLAVASRAHLLGTGELDWDEGVYWLSMQSMQAGHPLFTSVYSSQPPAFLLLTEPPWAALGGGIAAARALMLAWGLVAIVAGSVIGWRLAGPVAAVLTAVVLAVDPLMVRQSVVLQADGPAVALGLVAVALAAVAVTARGRWASAILGGLAGAAVAVGVLTKLIDVALAPPLLALVAWRAGGLRPAAAIAIGGVVTTLAVLLPLHGAWGAMWSQAVGLHIDTRSSSAGVSLGGALTLRWKLVAIAVVAGVVGWRRHPRLVATGVAYAVGAAAAMSLTHPLWPHHAVSVSPALALLCAAGGSAVFERVAALQVSSRRLLATGLTVAVAGGAALTLWSSVQEFRPMTGPVALAGALAGATPPGLEVVGDEQYAQALAHRPAPPGFVDTSNTRMYGEPGAVAGLEATLDGRPPVCAVLFSSGRFEQLPGFLAWVEQRYPERLTLVGPATLYSIPGCR